MEEIIDIAIKVLAALLALGLGWVGKHLVTWLKTNMDEKQAARLDQFIAEMVAAAEQLYKGSDPNGVIRLQYVQKMLLEAGYELTDTLTAIIESKVFEINTKGAEKNGN